MGIYTAGKGPGKGPLKNGTKARSPLPRSKGGPGQAYAKGRKKEYISE